MSSLKSSVQNVFEMSVPNVCLNISFKISGSNYSFKISGSNYSFKILWFKISGSNVVQNLPVLTIHSKISIQNFCLKMSVSNSSFKISVKHRPFVELSL